MLIFSVIKVFVQQPSLQNIGFKVHTLGVQVKVQNLGFLLSSSAHIQIQKGLSISAETNK